MADVTSSPDPVIVRETREPPRGGKLTAAWLWGLIVALVLAAMAFGTWYRSEASPPGRPGEVEGQTRPGVPAPESR